MSWWGEPLEERENPEPRYGPDPLTPEYLAEIKAYLVDCGANDRNDPEAYAVLNYVEDLLAEIDRLQGRQYIASTPAPGPAKQ